MDERFLSFVWKNRLFDSNNLCLNDGSTIEVLSTGEQNTDAGPDFFNVKIRHNGTIWAGNAEIHTYASDWYRHGHHTNKAFNKCYFTPGGLQGSGMCNTGWKNVAYTALAFR